MFFFFIFDYNKFNLKKNVNKITEVEFWDIENGSNDFDEICYTAVIVLGFRNKLRNRYSFAMSVCLLSCMLRHFCLQFGKPMNWSDLSDWFAFVGDRDKVEI